MRNPATTTPLQWNKSTSTLVLISHSAGVSEIYKKNSRKKNSLKFYSIFRVRGDNKRFIRTIAVLYMYLQDFCKIICHDNSHVF